MSDLPPGFRLENSPSPGLPPGFRLEAVPNKPAVVPSPYDDSSGPIEHPVVDALGRIGKAVVEGYDATPSLLTPAATRAVEEGGPVGRFLVSPAAKIVGGGLAAGNALFRGAQQAVVEALAPVDPKLARDVAAMPEAFMGSPGGLKGPRPIEASRPNPLLAAAEQHTQRLEAPLSVEFRDQPGVVTPSVVGETSRSPTMPDAVITVRPDPRPAEVTLPPPEAPPRPVTAEPPPRPAAPQAPERMPAGADIITSPIPEKTLAQATRDFDTQVKQTAADRAGPQGVDHTVYVEGVERPTAAREFSVENSVNENAQVSIDPAFAQKLRQTERNAKEVLLDKFNEIAGDPIELERAHETRSQVSPAEMRVFENEQPVDAGNVLAAIDGILAGPSGKRTAVVSVLKDIRDSLHDANGNLEVLPSQLYGARQNITDKLKLKTGDLASNARLAKAEMQRLLEVLDPTITQGAPLFEQYLAQFAELSKPINRMEFLQDLTLGPGKITNARGEIEFARVQRALERIAKERKKPGANAAKALEEEHLQALIAIRNELAAFAHRDELARVRGSNTTQLANAAARTGAGPLGQAIRTAGRWGMHLGLNAIMPGGVGNAAYDVATRAAEARRGRRTEAELAALRARLLETSPRNQLLD